MGVRGGRRGVLAGLSAVALAGAVLGSGVGAGADASPAIGVVLNGQQVAFRAGAPEMINDHVYVPVVDIAAALGLPVHWDQSTETVEIGVAAGAGGQTAAAVGGGSFTYQGLQYSVTGLVGRTYPGQPADSGTYWIVEYAITNQGTAPVDVPQAQPALGLFGPGGAQLSADSALSGPAPATINPGITFNSYDVFQVPGSAVPAAYRLGFDTYSVSNGQFTTTPLDASLPQNTSTAQTQTVGASYALQDVWSPAVANLTIASVTRTTQIVPGLTPESFDPTTSFWIVDFTVANPGPGDISVNQGQLSLDFNNSLSIAPTSLPTGLPGYVPASSLGASGGVLVPAGQSFSGALLFTVPAGTPTSNPGLSVSVNGHTEIVSLQPCTNGNCPPIQG